MSKYDFATFSGSLTADVLSYNPEAIPAPDTLVIRMTRGECRIADELRKQFGGFKRVVIGVDGEQHEFSADSLIRLLEGYEGVIEHVSGMPAGTAAMPRRPASETAGGALAAAAPDTHAGKEELIL